MTTAETKTTPSAPEDLLLDVWQAEDGRCEVHGCGRPMDRRVATARLVGKFWRLVCPCCAYGWEPFRLGIEGISPKARARLFPGEPPEPDVERASLSLLSAALSRYGVVTSVSGKRQPPNVFGFWLPGIGGFAIAAHRRKPAALCWASQPHAEATLRRKPQARTRGLPRLPRPEQAATGGKA
jgi:hypothetical protein